MKKKIAISSTCVEIHVPFPPTELTVKLLPVVDFKAITDQRREVNQEFEAAPVGRTTSISS